MEYYGFYFEQDKCINCHACELACVKHHHLPVDYYFRRVIEKGKPVSINCMHCIDPVCLKVCSQNAYEIIDGFVVHKENLCIGCLECMHSCPVQAITLMHQGTVSKCDSCISLRKEGKQPVCVAACPVHALHFTDLSNKEGKLIDNTHLMIKEDSHD